MRLWLLDKLARRYQTRPSDLLKLENTYDAYCLDEAIMVFASAVEQKIEDVPTPKGKRGHEKRQRMQQDLMNKLLRIPEAATKPKFRDPAKMMGR